MAHADEYRSYVEHPRFGREPRLTGFNPPVNEASDTHWHSGADVRIPNTAIRADRSKQAHAAGGRSWGLLIHDYFDVRRKCRDCGRKFIFFAAEQKYWYEELGFPLEVDCVRCHACRRDQRHLDRLRERYNQLVSSQPTDPAELLELARVSIELIAGDIFAAHPRTVARIRMWLNRLSGFPAHAAAHDELRQRLITLERAAQDGLRRTSPS